MSKKCSDPRCPLNIYLNAKELQKLQVKPCVTFSPDSERKSRSETKRSKCAKLKPKKSQEKDGRCGICCKNKRCSRPLESTTEPSTSTDSLKKARPKKSGMKKKAHRYEEEERCCKCRMKKCIEPKQKKKKQKRSRCKKKGKCRWLKNCLGTIFFCFKRSKKSRSSHVLCNSSPQYEYCCAHRDVR
uniref:uncharacterized protein LOC127072770 n=1 Tax=Vespula vulgaris TaxID=7454 RepID=UPI0021257FAC|nr:uncharacterized protein LOC127072770 [Vespula vulgaris]